MRRSASGEADPRAPARVRPEPGAPLLARLLFAPVTLIVRRLAPRLSARLFERIWSLIGGADPPPRPEQPQRSVSRLAAALALEGACAALVGGLLDQVSRREFARLTGRWPSRRRTLAPPAE
jgi:hypothetical protein